MRTVAEIKKAIDTLVLQAKILTREGREQSLACECCWATVAALTWALGPEPGKDDNPDSFAGSLKRLDERAKNMGATLQDQRWN